MNSAGSPVPDFGWVFLLIGLAIALPGLWLFYWATLKDRSRGRRRCPKCWYDMSGTTGMTCSECGYYAKRERKFFKTRRRWRVCAIAVILLFSAIATAIAPAIQSGGWPRLIPTTVLILLVPEKPGPNMILSGEVDRRLRSDELWDWQIRWMYRRVEDEQKAAWKLAYLKRGNWPEDSEVFYAADFDRQILGFAGFDRANIRIRIDCQGNNEIEFTIPAGSSNIPSSLWRDRFINAGRLKPGATVRLHSSIDVQVGDGISSPSRWVNLEDEVSVLTPRMHGRMEEHMKPVRSAAIDDIIREKLWVAVYDNAIRVLRPFPKIPELGDGGALGLTFELIHGDEVLASTTGWWGNNNAERRSDLLMWESGALDIGQMESSQSDRWVIRIRGNREAALRAFDDQAASRADQSQYWDGEVEIPLRVGKPNLYAIPQRELLPWNMWTWVWQSQDTQR